jgi:RNA polymerase sigma factor (sigma-70 family)
LDVGLAEVVTEDFAELFRVHYPRLIRAVQLAGAGLPDAEDIAQEAFARTLRHWRQVRTGTNPAGYVFRVAFRLSHRRGLLPTSPLDEELASGLTGPDELAAVKTDVERALALMPPRRRACVVLCWMSASTPVEAGEALGIAAGTVRKQLELARRQLAGELTP